MVLGPFNSDSQLNSLLSINLLTCSITLTVDLFNAYLKACQNYSTPDFNLTISGAQTGQIYFVIMGTVSLLGSNYSITLNQHSTSTASLAPKFTTTSTQPLCFGNSNGTVTVTATGNAPLRYSKDNVTFQSSNVLTGFAAGTHTIYVKDRNCQSSETVTITQPTALSHSTTKIDATACPGNVSINVTGIGGTTPYQYSINGGTNYYPGTNPKVFGALVAGSYPVMVRDTNNCTSAQTNVSLSGPVNPTIINISSVNPTCTNTSNGSITFSGNGGSTPYTYSINGGTNYNAGTNPYTASALNPGTYQLKVKAASGCESNTAIQLLTGQHPPPLGVITGSTICPGQQATLTFTASAGSGPFNLLINSHTYSGISTGVPFNVIPNPTVTTNYSLNQIIDNFGCITN